MSGGLSFNELMIRAAAVPRPGACKLNHRTLKTYFAWLRRFYEFTRRPASQWTGADVEGFCWWMEQQKYAPQSRKQALCAIIYAFKNVLGVDPGKLNLPAMPAEKKRVKILPSRDELGRIFAGLQGMTRLMAGLLYGSGMRVSECCELRMKDIDFETLTIRVHGGKGDKDRLVLLPERLVPALQRHMNLRAAMHERDVADGAGYVDLPGRYGLKNPSAARSLSWQFVFPSAVIRAGKRWWFTPQGMQKAIKRAVLAAGILKRVTPHTLRHAFCTHALQNGNDVATVQELMGHEDLETTQTYAHADKALGRSPLDGPVLRPVGEVTALNF